MRRAPWGRRTVELAAAVALVTTFGACGIPTDDHPQAIAPESIPDVILSPTPSIGAADQAVTSWIYLVLGGTDADEPDSLVREPVQVPSPGNPEQVLQRLAQGADEKQAERRLISAIPPRTEILATVDPERRDVLIVDTQELRRVEGGKQRIAAAQIVFTATEIPGIEFVRFRDGGTDIGISTDGPSAEPGALVSRRDFQNLERDLNGAGSVTTTTIDPADTPSTGSDLTVVPSLTVVES